MENIIFLKASQIVYNDENRTNDIYYEVCFEILRCYFPTIHDRKSLIKISTVQRNYKFQEEYYY